jgi:hypothetical protein
MHGNQHGHQWHKTVTRVNSVYEKEPAEEKLDFDKAGLFLYIQKKTSGAGTHTWLPVVNTATFFYRPLGLGVEKSPYRLYRLKDWLGPAAPEAPPNGNALATMPKVIFFICFMFTSLFFCFYFASLKMYFFYFYIFKDALSVCFMLHYKMYTL